MRTKRQKARSERAGKGHEVPLSRQALALLRECVSEAERDYDPASHARYGAWPPSIGSTITSGGK